MLEINNVQNWLREVEHPAKGDKNVVELGMVENIEVAEGAVTVTLAFSKHRDPLAEYLIGSAKAAIIRKRVVFIVLFTGKKGYQAAGSPYT